MDDIKRKMKERIDALLSKTVENGATEEEAMAAMQKAMELIAKYQIDMTEKEAREQGAIMSKISFKLPLAQFAAFEILYAVGQASGTRGFRIGKENFYFVGLEEDVKFALWLIQSLALFAVNAVNEWWKSPDNYIPSSQITGGERVRLKESFIKGFAGRVTVRVNEEKKKEKEKATTGTALVVVKDAVITDFFKNNGINPKSKSDRKNYSTQAKSAGFRKGAEAQLRKVEQIR